MSPDRWTLILAGGDGNRLRSLTRDIAGDERPKQFCPVIGGRTLLEQTRRRTALVAPPDRTLIVLTRRHERFYSRLLPGLQTGHVVVQPDNRGTAPGILYPLLRLRAMAPTAAVAIFPSDHYFSDEARFMAHVDSAFDSLAIHPLRVVLLGITPDTHETEYGWIEPAGLLPGPLGSRLYQVKRFWEKPEVALAEVLRERGCFWNSFVMVARVDALLGVMRSAAPELHEAFASVAPALGTASEEQAVRAVYARLAPVDFSSEILSERPEALALLPVRGVVWSDLGNPERVRMTWRRLEGVAALAER